MATTRQKEALHARLIERWARLLESEMDSDGFWETVATTLGKDLGDLTESELRLAHSHIRAARQWLAKLPAPVLPS